MQNETSSAPGRETVLLIHGTYAQQNLESIPQWYEPGSEFIAKLDAALASHCNARCWAHVPPGDDRRSRIFTWNGENSWRARSQASAQLAALLDELVADGWRCHVVAHSHGGNLLVETLHRLEPNGRWQQGRFVTFSTPFIKTWDDSTTDWSQRGLSKDLWISVGIIVAACLLACLPSPLRDAYQPMLHLAWWMMLPLAIVGGIVAIGAAVYFRFWFLRGFNAPDFNAFEFSPGTDEQRLLVLNTHEDEAFQLLARIMQLPNPFHSLSDRWWPRVLLRHFCQWWPSAFTEAKKRDLERFPRQSCTLRLFLYTGLALPALRVWISSAVTPSRLFADALTGTEFGWIIVALIWIAIQPKAAIAEISFPVRFCRFFSSLLTSSLREVGVLFFRMKGWGYLKRRALGLEGYPLEEPAVGLEPSSLSKPYYHFERVPGAVIGDALAKRQTHVNRSLALVTKALAHREFTIGDIDPLLKSIAEDTTLVHSVCYLSDSVINVVARWLAKTETEIESDARARFNTEISGEYNYYTPDPPRDLYWR